jgi:hypothetical protein
LISPSATALLSSQTAHWHIETKVCPKIALISSTVGTGWPTSLLSVEGFADAYCQAQVLSQTHDTSFGAVIVVDPHDTVTLTGVTVAQLQAAQTAHHNWLS